MKLSNCCSCKVMGGITQSEESVIPRKTSQTPMIGRCHLWVIREEWRIVVYCCLCMGESWRDGAWRVLSRIYWALVLMLVLSLQNHSQTFPAICVISDGLCRFLYLWFWVACKYITRENNTHCLTSQYPNAQLLWLYELVVLGAWMKLRFVAMAIP